MLRKVGGDTLRPTAIVTTRSMGEMGFRGFSSTPVTCDLRIYDETMLSGEGVRGDWRLHIGARRYLTQLGKGQSTLVRRVADKSVGVVIEERRCMTRIVVDFDLSFFEMSPDTVVTAMHITDIVKHVVGESVDMQDVVVREDGTATVRVPTSCVQKLQLASGKCGASFKTAYDEPTELEYVLWLAPGLAREEAEDVATAMGSYGFIWRGKQQRRYGLRWKTQEEYDKAVTMIPGMEHLAGSTRYKVLPVVPEVGAQGMKEMLAAAGWVTQEVVYTDRDAAQGSAVVYAKGPPPVAKFTVKSRGMPYEVHILPVGRMSQKLMDEKGVGNVPRERPRARDLNDGKAAERARAALARTQRPTARTEANKREREPTGDTPVRKGQPPEGGQMKD